MQKLGKSETGEMAAKTYSVLITGANRGLGLEMVKQMVETKRPIQKLFACCRDPAGPRSEALQALAKKHPNVITVIRLDVTDLSSIKQSAQQVGSLVGTGGLNLLVNNAGVLAQSNLMTTSPEDMQAAFNTNIMGPMNATKEFLPLLQTAARASGAPGMSCCKAAVINITTVMASMTALAASYSIAPALSYRISKAGLNMLMLCCSEEFRKDGILFAGLHPGWVRTEMGGSVANEADATDIEAQIDPPESVEGMLRVMDSLTDKQNGAFLDYQGKPVPW